jgi:NADH-quinone oxidoreductase subunit J
VTGLAIVIVIFAVVAVVSALSVILSEDPVHSALALIANLMSIAVLYYSLNAPFLLAVQLLVYAGAVVVLFLFVVMLLRTEGAGHPTTPLAWLRPLSLLGAMLLLAGIVWVVKVDVPRPAATGFPVVGDPEAIGRVLYKAYIVPFQATGVLLLAALVGALYLGRRMDQPLEGERTAAPEPLAEAPGPRSGKDPAAPDEVPYG